MTRTNADTEVDRLLVAAIDDLETAAKAKRMNHFVAMCLGSIANLVGNQQIVERATLLLSELTAADSFRWAITNFDWRKRSRKELDRLHAIEPADTFAANHPIYDRASPVPELQKFSQHSPHLQFCLQGQIDRALAAAEIELDYEELANTLAALGKFDDAIDLIDSAPVSPSRRQGVRMVVLVEKCRRLVPGFAEEISRFNPLDFNRLHIILALLGRRPWPAYPYPDY